MMMMVMDSSAAAVCGCHTVINDAVHYFVYVN